MNASTLELTWLVIGILALVTSAGALVNTYLDYRVSIYEDMSVPVARRQARIRVALMNMRNEIIRSVGLLAFTSLAYFASTEPPLEDPDRLRLFGPPVMVGAMVVTVIATLWDYRDRTYLVKLLRSTFRR